MWPLYLDERVSEYYDTHVELLCVYEKNFDSTI